MGAAALAGTRVSRSTTTEKSAAATVMEQKTARRTGSFDLSPETLEYELRELLTALRLGFHQAVFIIDELDKLEVDEEPVRLEEHVIFTILASLKNFFTLGSGIFIFISGEDFYARLEESITQHSYSLAHTIFTDRLFLHVLPYGDLEVLIDGLLQDQPAHVETYKKFRNYLCWESRSHVFDLLSLLGDYVTSYDGNQPVVFAHESYVENGSWHEGNLPEDWEVAAGLQKIVGATYDENSRPGAREERFNQALWLTLLDVARSVFETGNVAVQKLGYETSPSGWTDHLRERDVDDLSGAVDRFLARAERYGLLKTSESTVSGDKAMALFGETDPLEIVTYELEPDPLYPDSSVAKHAAPTPFEKTFLNLTNTLRIVQENLESSGVVLEEEEYAQVQSVAGMIVDRPERKSPPRSDVRDALRAADHLLPEMVSRGVVQLVEEWADQHGYDWEGLEGDPLSRQWHPLENSSHSDRSSTTPKLIASLYPARRERIKYWSWFQLIRILQGRSTRPTKKPRKARRGRSAEVKGFPSWKCGGQGLMSLSRFRTRCSPSWTRVNPGVSCRGSHHGLSRTGHEMSPRGWQAGTLSH